MQVLGYRHGDTGAEIQVLRYSSGHLQNTPTQLQLRHLSNASLTRRGDPADARKARPSAEIACVGCAKVCYICESS